MGTTDNPNILFRLSGVTPLVSGVYRFEQNPETYTLMAPKQMTTILPTLIGENIYQRALLDNEIRIMRWSRCSNTLYNNLKPYSARTTSGVIPTVYFWDGTVKEFQGTTVQIIDVYGKPNQGEDWWTVELQFKPVAYFDKEYGTTSVLGPN